MDLTITCDRDTIHRIDRYKIRRKHRKRRGVTNSDVNWGMKNEINQEREGEVDRPLVDLTIICVVSCF